MYLVVCLLPISWKSLSIDFLWEGNVENHLGLSIIVHNKNVSVEFQSLFRECQQSFQSAVIAHGICFSSRLGREFSFLFCIFYKWSVCLQCSRFPMRVDWFFRFDFYIVMCQFCIPGSRFLLFMFQVIILQAFCNPVMLSLFASRFNPEGWKISPYHLNCNNIHGKCVGLIYM